MARTPRPIRRKPIAVPTTSPSWKNGDARINLHIGKIRSTGSKNPWEPGFIEAIHEQLSDLTNIIKSMADQLKDASPQLVINALGPTMDLALEYCPVDTGALRASAYLESVGYRGQPRVEMGFARGGEPYYAVVVHEDMSAKHEPPTRAKWLQEAVQEDMVNLWYRINDEYQKFLHV